jgi:mono/diheme cytochrome c family protein
VKKRSTVWVGSLISLVFVGSLVLTARGDQQSPDAGPGASPVAAHQAVVNRYCVSCHNDKVKSAGLSLSGMDVANPGAHADVWEKVVRKLNGRAMPPIGRPRPDDATYQSLATYLEGSLDRIAASSPNPGRTETFRRLTRTEYRNAIRDLLAVDVEVQSLLPPDDSSFGFDNVTVGTLSPTLMERYLSAAQKISRLAIGSTVRVPQTHVVTLPVDLTQEQHFAELPLGTRGGTVFPYTFPVDGEYEIQVRLYRDRDEHVEGLGRQGRGDDSVSQKHELELTLDGKQVTIFTVETPTSRSSNDPRDYDDSEIDKGFNARIPVTAGPHEIAATFLKKPTVILETVRQPYPVAFNMDRHPRMQPAVFKVVVTGPFEPTGAGDTPSRQRIFICRPASAAQETGCAKRIISTFVRRAYRRPVTDDDLKTPMAFYEQGRSDGGFDAGIETALRKILIAPEFLFRVERDPSPASSAYRISDVELASRLSFFLWSSIPDDQLLDIAARGKLRDQKVLEQQVRRMLADPRSSSLVDNFAGQWLYLRNLAALQPDGRMFTTFDDNLRQAFKQETELFFNSIMRENRSVLDLLSANYTFLDERLAKHYGVPDVYGTQFRRVTLPAGSVRGGLLGQGSILLATSYANRTSPVLRGKWVLENIMGTPPPAPPPGVPPLKENKSENQMPTMRERMAQHRDNPACSSCHMLMDPIGLSMENFDAIGRWRTKGEDGAPVDATGGLPNGQTFEGVGGLKQALLSRPELFVAAVSEKLLTFALGRGIEPYDGPAVRGILKDSRADNYRFATVVSNIVKSAPFQMRSASRVHATN